MLTLNLFYCTIVLYFYTILARFKNNRSFVKQNACLVASNLIKNDMKIQAALGKKEFLYLSVAEKGSYLYGVAGTM